jgi:hypothetical protein
MEEAILEALGMVALVLSVFFFGSNAGSSLLYQLAQSVLLKKKFAQSIMYQVVVRATLYRPTPRDTAKQLQAPDAKQSTAPRSAWD